MAKEIKPKQVRGGTSTEGKEKTSMYIEIPTLDSLKYIEYHDDRTRTDIVNEALIDYIAKWEKKNGPVPKKS